MVQQPQPPVPLTAASTSTTGKTPIVLHLFTIVESIYTDRMSLPHNPLQTLGLNLLVSTTIVKAYCMLPLFVSLDDMKIVTLLQCTRQDNKRR